MPWMRCFYTKQNEERGQENRMKDLKLMERKQSSSCCDTYIAKKGKGGSQRNIMLWTFLLSLPSLEVRTTKFAVNHGGCIK